MFCCNRVFFLAGAPIADGVENETTQKKAAQNAANWALAIKQVFNVNPSKNLIKNLHRH